MAATRAGAELVAAYRLQLGRLKGEARRLVETAWVRLGHYDEADVRRFLDQVLPRIIAGVAVATALTDGYIAAYTQAELGQPRTPLGIRPLPTRPVPAEVVYLRPFLRVWRQLDSGTRWTAAVQEGRDYAGMLAETDIQLANRNSANLAIAAEQRIVGWRRVLGPGRNCGLCIVASTQRYHRRDLLPIHPRCGCGVEPMFGRQPAAKVIDRERLALIKEQLKTEDLPYTRSAMSRLRIDLEELPKVEVRQHGELGPLLTDASNQFTDLAATG